MICAARKRPGPERRWASKCHEERWETMAWSELEMGEEDDDETEDDVDAAVEDEGCDERREACRTSAAR
jgi:hypothetical protein